MMFNYFKVHYESVEGDARLVFPFVRFPFCYDSEENLYDVKQRVEQQYGIRFPRYIAYLGVTYEIYYHGSNTIPTCSTSFLYSFQGKSLPVRYTVTNPSYQVPIEEMFKHFQVSPFLPFQI